MKESRVPWRESRGFFKDFSPELRTGWLRYTNIHINTHTHWLAQMKANTLSALSLMKSVGNLEQAAVAHEEPAQGDAEELCHLGRALRKEGEQVADFPFSDL